MFEQHVIITGGAGLVGQNLLVLLKEADWRRLTVIDKHAANLNLVRHLHPDVQVIEADLSQAGAWQEAFVDCDLLVLGQAQIGGLDYAEFEANNIVATERILSAARAGNQPFIIHLSSSVVNSLADDFYTRSKSAQEEIVLASGLAHCVLRPTLMFGWFDRKHLGWLARFMKRTPVFPIPGNGRYLRQPLYVQDFCRVILACMNQRPVGQVFDITGLERVHYIDLIRELKAASAGRSLIMKIPYGLFRTLLAVYARFNRNPPFTVQQLEALVTPDEFELIDWPGIFSVKPTPLEAALRETFNHPRYASLELAF